MYLISTTCSMSRMFSWFLEMENKALERCYRSTFKAASECKCEGSIVCKPLTYEIRLMSLVISTLVKDSRLANFRSSSWNFADVYLRPCSKSNYQLLN